MIALVTATGKSICRRQGETCLFKGWTKKGPRTIAQGARALQISIYSANGAATAFYCDECMKPILESCKNILEEISK